MFAHFTKEASGHNPRAQNSKRLRNRVAHKFIHYPEKYGEPACTGCGTVHTLLPGLDGDKRDSSNPYRRRELRRTMAASTPTCQTSQL